MAGFLIRNLPIPGDLILAPMDGFTDWPFRLICRELGSAMSYTEFVNVDEIAFAKRSDGAGWDKLGFQPAERPVAFQLYGNNEKRIVATAQRLQELRPDCIDINLGCSIRKIAERGAGAGMLKDPAAIGRLFAVLTKALNIPVTAKIRLGWDAQSRNYLEVARALEDNGCAMIAVHARTREQVFSGDADWAAIGEIKQRASIPVVGNGNVRTVADIDRIRNETGCDGVMIGRAAIGHPWIFARREKASIPLTDCVEMALRHLGLMIELYGEKFGPIIFRKHAVRYVHHIQKVGRLRSRLGTCSSTEEFRSMFAEALDWEGEHPEESGAPTGSASDTPDISATV